MAGTWINEQKVGKDVVWPLEHNATISFGAATKKVFVFFSNDADKNKETFPEELSSKYLIRSKVLGSGATGEVRLAFKISDFERFAVKIIKKCPVNTFTVYKGPSAKQ